jgi:hypothetical protein
MDKGCLLISRHPGVSLGEAPAREAGLDDVAAERLDDCRHPVGKFIFTEFGVGGGLDPCSRTAVIDPVAGADDLEAAIEQCCDRGDLAAHLSDVSGRAEA